jgi:hypothetical protein
MHFESEAQLYVDMVAEAAVVGLSYPVAVACCAIFDSDGFTLVAPSVRSDVAKSAFDRFVGEVWNQTRLSEDECVRMDSFLAAMRKRYGFQ